MDNLNSEISFLFSLTSKEHFLILEHFRKLNIDSVLLDFRLGLVRDSYLISLVRNFLKNKKQLENLTFLHFSLNKDVRKERFSFTAYNID
jgi:hypothetical protein